MTSPVTDGTKLSDLQNTPITEECGGTDADDLVRRPDYGLRWPGAGEATSDRFISTEVATPFLEAGNNVCKRTTGWRWDRGRWDGGSRALEQGGSSQESECRRLMMSALREGQSV
jgi:hypothetical protein